MRMKPNVLVAAGAALLLLAGCRWVPAGDSAGDTASGTAAGPVHASIDFTYPETRTVDQVDDYHGTQVADPYRWLEDLDSEETAAWVAAQNEITFGYLEAIPARARIIERLTEVWDYEKFGRVWDYKRYRTPGKHGGRYFYLRNDGLQSQAVLYVQDTLDGEPRVLIDPNTLSEDGTVAMAFLAISRDGRYAAYAVSTSGSDWVEIKVRDIDTGQDTDDHIRWVKFGGASWADDSEGFYYGRYDEPTGDALQDVNQFHKIYYHRLGTGQAEDPLVFDTPDEPEWGIGAGVSEDGRYLILSIGEGSDPRSRVYYRDLRDAPDRTVKLLDDYDAVYNFLGNEGPLFWFHTDLDAPRGRVIGIDVRSPGRENWREIIPEGPDTMDDLSVVGDRIIVQYLHNAYSLVRVFDLEGNAVRDVDLPGIGTAAGFGGSREDRETFYIYGGYTTPGTLYHYDLDTGRSTLFRQPELKFDPDDFVTEQVFYESKDGTRVSMFLSYRKGLEPDGNRPTCLYGYGGFNISMSPYFSLSRIIWMEMGGVYAVPNLRGGGEYGKEWHDAGRLHQKQNTWDDFHAAAEWLIASGWTRSEKLAIYGASNGGLLVGACMLQRPELYGAALPDVGVMDMLRFHKFTIGWAWTSDFGSPDDPEHFPSIYAYSPLHNIVPGTCYPATLVTTADHDDRVVPSHSFKFTSALQKAQACAKPTLIRVDVKAGHGAGKPTAMQIAEVADSWAFLADVLEVDY